MKWQISSTGLPVRWNTRLHSHTPRAHTFLPPPPFSLVFVMLLFFLQQTTFFLLSFVCLRSLLDFSLFLSVIKGPQRGKQGVQVINLGDGEPEVYQRTERLGSVRLHSSLVEILRQHIHTASVCKVMTAFCLLQVIISTVQSCYTRPCCY